MQLYTLDNGRVQYYIPESESKSGEYNFSIAMTYRDDTEIEHPVVINYSVLSPDRRIEIPISESICTPSEDTIHLDRISLLYREIQGKTGIVRISSKLSRANFIKLLESSASSFQIEYQNGRILHFEIPSRFKEDLHSIFLYSQNN